MAFNIYIYIFIKINDIIVKKIRGNIWKEESKYLE